MNESVNRLKATKTYFMLVMLIGGLAYLPWVLGSYGLLPEYIMILSVISGGASPTIAAIIAARFEDGPEGPKKIFRQFSLGKKELGMDSYIYNTSSSIQPNLRNHAGGYRRH